MQSFNKVLVANRGEIACRVFKTLKNMGISSVAVYSDADQKALHTSLADEAYHIGSSPSKESYLDVQKIINVAKSAGVDAIHPGYGFLSENSHFASCLAQENIKLIGPSAYSMDLMGDKLSSKEAVKKYGIPMVPGTDYAIDDIKDALSIGEKLGYPVLIKASAGGGGKGMKLAYNSSEMKDLMQLAINEANAAFGNGAVFIEKFITNPRHIEIQILADSHGNCVYLFERECSIQRRHQKVIEEAPSATLKPEVRKAMGEAAVKVAKACNYEGAGTVEFLIDGDQNFYFLEMNTRLQVEHPVTEMITGIDLVKEQIHIAQGRKLSFSQEDLKIDGHAIELRIYAEDPMDNFSPSINTLSIYQLPNGEGVRVDNGYQAGDQIPIYYDPMIAKLIVHGNTRLEAIQKMKKAIANYKIDGIKNTLNFGAFVMSHPHFIHGDFDTSFIDKNWNSEERNNVLKHKTLTAANIFEYLISQHDNKLKL
jgi:propionyl-CoA carboxylase alpha chain